MAIGGCAGRARHLRCRLLHHQRSLLVAIELFAAVVTFVLAS
jgi:hypothetical protein